MTSDLFDLPNWHSALTLSERIQLAQSSLDEIATDGRSEWRYDRWRVAGGFSDSDFGACLIERGLEKEIFLSLLAESPSSLASRVPQDLPWMRAFRQAFGGWSDHCFDQFQSYRVHPFSIIGFSLAMHGMNELRVGLAKMVPENELRVSLATLDKLLVPELLQRIYSMAVRSLTLELNLARVEGRLVGDSADDRFHNFVRAFKDRDHALAFLSQYPVLARQIVLCTDLWVSFSLELLVNMARDWSEILTNFSNGRDPGLISNATMGAGDRHRGGKSVTFVRFESGLRLMYKPRSVAVEEHFSGLLQWVNDALGRSVFKPIRVLNRGAYGWVEFAPVKTCNSIGELESFYYQQGGYLALLYLLDGTDIHFGNVVASGEHPIIVDLETLFCPPIRKNRGAQGHLDASVFRSMLLPTREIRGYGDLGPELSALAAQPGDLSEATVFERGNTDEMALVRKRIRSRTSKHLPTLQGKPVSMLDYEESLLKGFSDIYKLFIEQRRTLTAKDGPIFRFADDPIRIVLRRTAHYGDLLSTSYHPDFCADALDRESILQKVWRIRGLGPSFLKIAAAEYAELLNGDIPYFTAKPSERHIWTSDGTEITNFMESTPIECVLQRLNALSEEDLARQLTYIRGSIACTRPITSIGLRSDSEPLSYDERAISDEDILVGAREIGDHLLRTAHDSAHGLSWIGVTLIGPDTFGFRPVGMDLYSGQCGIALFLGHLGEISGDRRYTAAARKALQAAGSEIQHMSQRLHPLGAFTGIGGYIYALAELGQILDLSGFLEELRQAITDLIPRISGDEVCDIICGSSGLLAVLLRVYELTKFDECLDAAEACARNLVSRFITEDEGLGWRTIADTPVLSGFSHGNAGIAWALLRFADLASCSECERIAVDAIAFERTLFIEKERNWEDRRLVRKASRKHTMSAWCHGAPGIGLSRMTLPDRFKDDYTRAEVQIGIETTLRTGFGGNHSLCHGDLGNLEFIGIAARSLSSEHLRQRAEAVLRLIFARMRHDGGWTCGTPKGADGPGLMAGFSGIGYGLLRFVAPEKVPCVLLLSGPL